jgi:ubiquitin
VASAGRRQSCQLCVARVRAREKSQAQEDAQLCFFKGARTAMHSCVFVRECVCVTHLHSPKISVRLRAR